MKLILIIYSIQPCISKVLFNCNEQKNMNKIFYILYSFFHFFHFISKPLKSSVLFSLRAYLTQTGQMSVFNSPMILVATILDSTGQQFTAMLDIEITPLHPSIYSLTGLCISYISFLCVLYFSVLAQCLVVKKCLLSD